MSSSHTPSTERLAKGLPPKLPIPGVRNVILISSAKGGVGKSATTVNLALTTRQLYRDKSVGILDLDVFGPSIPKMMNLENHEPEVDDKNRLLPLVNYGVKVMSMGFLIPKDGAVVWRGLMVMQGVQRLLRQVYWGFLDYLFIDLPPGTGDVQLSVAQNITTSGAVIVSTPQAVSLLDTKRGMSMMKKVGISIIGLVENMSHFSCPSCGSKHHLFGDSSLIDNIANEEGTTVLSRIPYDPQLVTCNDTGKPFVIEYPDQPVSIAYKQLTQEIMQRLPPPLVKD